SSTTTARTPGAPAGSYRLGDGDAINLFTGNLNYQLQGLGIGGRGEAQAGLGVVIEGQWDFKETELGNGFVQHEYSYSNPQPLAFVGYVMLDISFVDTHSPCSNSGGNWLTYRV